MNVVTTTLAATLFIQLGYFLWKLAADRQKGRTPPTSGGAGSALLGTVSDIRWQAGLIATTGGWILFLQATRLGDISLVQPLMSAGDVLLVLLAVTYLKERLRPAEWLGLAVTMAGGLLMAIGAEDRQASTSGGMRLIAVSGAVLGTCAVLATLARTRRVSLEFSLPIVIGLSFGMGAILSEALTADHYPLGLHTLANPLLYGVIATNAVGLVVLQIAFRIGRASIIVPVQLAVANGLSIVGGIVVFQEPARALQLLGACLITGGIALMKAKTSPTQSQATV